MAGTIKKRQKTGQRLLLRPAADTRWEVWSFDEGGLPQLTQACESPADAPVTPQTVMALPLRQLYAVPLWLATPDPALVRNMIYLQLERRGLAAGRSSQELIFDYRTVASVENKTLVLAVVLPGSLPPELCVDTRFYEPSARVYPLPPDSFVLWREYGRIVLAVTRGAELAYFQALGDDAVSTQLLGELQCIKLQLETEEAVIQPRGLVLWGEFSAMEVSSAGEALGLRGTLAPLPAPALPAEWMNLVPASVRKGQEEAAASGRKRSLVMALVAAYLVLLFALLLHAAWVFVDCKRLESKLNSHETEVAGIEATAQRWDALAGAIDPESYPVEMLLRTSSLLPSDGVRFTLFSINGPKVLIQGEAANSREAFKFSEDLKHSKDLGAYQWNMPNPATLPNGSAKFQAEGVKYGAKAE